MDFLGTNTILHVVVILCGAAVVSGQLSWHRCQFNYRDDEYSPFYWPGYQQICTKTLCDTYPWLKCDVAKSVIQDQVLAHYPEDIEQEITYLGKYFKTLLPPPPTYPTYQCKGVCQNAYNQPKLERIFTKIQVQNPDTFQLETKTHMCIVIGPELHYTQCGGICDLPYGRGRENVCVPDVTVKVDIWVYCPEAYPGCHKVKFDVPLSCSCKRMRCRKELPPIKEVMPMLPDIPVAMDPMSPAGIPLGPANPFQGHQDLGGLPMTHGK